MQIGMPMGLRKSVSLQQQALAIFKRLTTSPAGVYTFGQGYLQTPANLVAWSQDFTNASWAKRGTAAVNPTPVTGPTGALNGYAVTGLDAGNNDIYQLGATTPASGNLSPAFWIKKVSTTGTMRLENAQNSGRGQWTIDLSLIGTGWELIGAGHPAITTVNFPFTSASADGLMLKGNTGGPLAINIALAGLFVGTLTAAQIQAMGGIPWTMGTASVAITNNGNLMLNSAGAVVTYDSLSGTTPAVVTPNNVVAPDGTTTGTTIAVPSTNLLNVAGGTGSVFTAVSGTAYTMSRRFRPSAATSYTFSVRFGTADGSGTGGVNSTITVTNGAITAATNGVAIAAEPNGWYRLSTPITPTGFTSGQVVTQLSTFSAANSIALWGFQIELGSTATAYTPTTSSAVAQTIVACPVYTNADVYLPGGSQTVYGPELVTNGGFDSATGWTIAGGWSISGGLLVSTASTGNADFTSAALVDGKSYAVTYTILSNSGSISLNLGGTAGTIRTTPGTYTETLVAASTAGVGARVQPRLGSTPNATIDNISVREVLTVSATLSGLSAGNYTLSDGSTGVAEVDGPDGLVLDAAGTVGSDVLGGAGGFTSSTGWTLSGGAAISGGTLQLPAGNATAISSIICDAGKTYQVDFDYISGSGAQFINVQAGSAAFGVAVTTTTRHYTVYIQASATAAIKIWQDGGVAGSAIVDDFTVKQVTGIHASQPTAGFRPRLERGARNLLTYSQDLTNAVWTVNNASKTTGQPDHLGGTTAARLVADTSSNVHRFTKGAALVIGTVYTASVYVKAAGYNFFGLKSGQPGQPQPVFNLATGTLVEGFGTIVSVGNGWYRCSHTFTAQNTGYVTYWTTLTTGVFDNEVFVGDGVSGTLMAFGQLETGSIASDYTPTTTAAASNPLAGRYSWAFDGDDRLNLASAPFQMVDDHCVVAGMSSSEIGTGWRTVFSQGGGTSVPRLSLLSAEGSRRMAAVYRDDSGLLVQITGDVLTATPAIGTIRKVGTLRELRQNSVQKGTSSVVLGATTFTNYAIGSMAGADMHLGSIGPVIVIKGAVSDSDLLTLERFVSALTPNGPQF